MEALLDAHDLSTPAGRRDLALFEVMYSACTRAAETVGINFDDIEFGRGMARVRGKERKGVTCVVDHYETLSRDHVIVGWCRHKGAGAG